MRVLYDRNGTAVAWLSNSDEWIIDNQGRPIGLIRDGTIYDWHGRPAGWWNYGQVHDLDGRVVLILRDAPHLRVPRPPFRAPPSPPLARSAPVIRTIGLKPKRRVDKPEWGNGIAFLNRLTMNGTGFRANTRLKEEGSVSGR